MIILLKNDESEINWAHEQKIIFLVNVVVNVCLANDLPPSHALTNHPRFCNAMPLILPISGWSLFHLHLTSFSRVENENARLNSDLSSANLRWISNRSRQVFWEASWKRIFFFELHQLLHSPPPLNPPNWHDFWLWFPFFLMKISSLRIVYNWGKIIILMMETISLLTLLSKDDNWDIFDDEIVLKQKPACQWKLFVFMRTSRCHSAAKCLRCDRILLHFLLKTLPRFKSNSIELEILKSKSFFEDFNFLVYLF